MHPQTRHDILNATSSRFEIRFFLQITWFCVPLWFCYQLWLGCNASPPCVINVMIFSHVWNLVKFRTEKVWLRFPGLFYFCIIKCQSRTVLFSVQLFLCVTCDLTCGLWPVTWPVTCDLYLSPADYLRRNPRRSSNVHLFLRILWLPKTRREKRTEKKIKREEKTQILHDAYSFSGETADQFPSRN